MLESAHGPDAMFGCVWFVTILTIGTCKYSSRNSKFNEAVQVDYSHVEGILIYSPLVLVVFARNCPSTDLAIHWPEAELSAWSARSLRRYSTHKVNMLSSPRLVSIRALCSSGDFSANSVADKSPIS